MNQPISPVTFPWAKVNNQKVTLSFKPATQADEEALASLLPEGKITDISQLPTTISAYLISVLPEIKLNGTVIATGNPMQLGEDVDLSYKVSLPTHGAKIFYSPVVAGSYVSIATIGGSVSVKKLSELEVRIAKNKNILDTEDPALLQTINRGNLLGDMFYVGTMGYFAQYISMTYVSGLQQGAHQELMPSIGTYGYVPKVNYFFGFPQSISPGGIEMDLDSVSTFTGTKMNDQAQLVNFVRQTGTLSSLLEHVVPEQMFSTQSNPGEAVSAVKAIALASQQGQRTYHITSQNQLTALPHINHDTATINEISAAISIGKEVITHTDSINLNGWSGAGYIILDPETGDGAYKISGGSNGGFLLFWGAVVFLTIVIILAVLSFNVVGLFFALLAFSSFIDRVKKIASSNLTPEQMNTELNKAAAFAVIGGLGGLALKGLGAIGKTMQWFLRGIMFMFGSVWYG